MKSSIVSSLDFISNVAGIAFAICAFAPGSMLDLVIPWTENRVRNYAVIALGMLIFAPINITLFVIEHGCEALADFMRTDDV
jgi:hypothetical protein